MTALRINCPECGGSGLRMGTYGDITCFDCSGEGQWDEPKCEWLRTGVRCERDCPTCDKYAAVTERDLRFTLELQRKRA